MKREPAWRRYLRFWGANPAADVDDEFGFHLQTKINALRAAGWSEESARREAVRQFGPVAPVRAECVAISTSHQRRNSWIEYLHGWAGDLRYAVRVLRNAKASTAAAILILAGIGATTAVFTILDRLLYAPLPVPKPAELALVSHFTLSPKGAHLGVTFTFPGYRYLRDHQKVFTALAAEASVIARERRAHQKIERPATGAPVSTNFFEVLGVQPLAGRWLTSADETAQVAVAGYRFASRRYEQPSDAMGKTVYLSDIPFTIVGVMPPGFYGTHKGYDSDLYIPLGCAQQVVGGIDLDTGAYLRAIGRLRRGVNLTRAQSDLQVLWRQFLALGLTRDSKDDQIGCETGLRGYAGTGGARERSLDVLGAIVVVLLLIGCANVACLLIARGAARQHETAIRLSLGAGRLRILRQSAAESGALALAGCAGALVVSHWAGRLLVAAFHWQTRPIEIAPDARVLAFALALSLLSAILFGLAPAVQLLRGGQIPLGRGQSVAPFAFGRILVVLEVALSLVLMAGAAVFVRSFQNLHAVPIGFVADHVSVLRFSHDTDDSPKAPIQEAAVLADSLRGTAGVQKAGLSGLLMFNDAYVMSSLRKVEDPAIQSIHLLTIGPGYFETLRIPLLAGRELTERDNVQAPSVAVVSESLARKLFPGRNPLGKRVFLARAVLEAKPGDETEIVGIVKDTRFARLADPPPDIVYTSLFQNGSFGAGVVMEIRSSLDPRAVGALAAARIRAAHLPLTLRSATRLSDEIGDTLADDYIRMQASSLFGGLALVLIASGLYGLIAYSVARRAREIGIRMAVGSSTGGIVGIVVRQSLELVAVGVAVGIPGAVMVMRAVSSLVFGLPPVDYASLTIAAALLGAAGLAASCVPAWRAAHLDPMKALRVE
ncbi:MAG TPA: ADOP family duplicated permease [Bryobacteraceae bacterium]|nr:ADOP family duplicated permease [Bryobacteraceae bacterium]